MSEVRAKRRKENESEKDVLFTNEPFVTMRTRHFCKIVDSGQMKSLKKSCLAPDREQLTPVAARLALLLCWRSRNDARHA